MKKIISIAVDIILIGVVFFVTDTVVLRVLETSNVWLELCVYLAIYALVFGAKSGTIALWKRIKGNKKTR